MGDGDLKDLGQWGPANRDNGTGRGLAHQRNRFAKQKDLNLMTSFRQGIGM